MRCRPAIACAVWLLASAAAAGSDVAVGFGGRYRAGSWTPVVVSGAAVGEELRVAVQDPDAVFVRSPPVRSGGGTVRFHVRFGRPSGLLRIENATAGTTTDLELPPPLPSTTETWLLAGELPALTRAARLMPRGDGARPTVIGGPIAEWSAAVGGGARDFDGVDTIVACGRALADVEPALAAGIDAWIREGGRLVLAAGLSAGPLAMSGGPAADWLPGPVGEFVPLRRVAALEAHARASGLAERSATSDLRVPLLGNRRSIAGIVEVFEGSAATDLPLVVRRAHGLGVITWVGLDLDAEPFRGWPGTDTLLVRLLGGRVVEMEGPRAVQPLGPPDLAGQLRTALEAPGPDVGFAPASFGVIAALGLLYLACIFPLEWWLVSRSGRPWIAWVTLPTLVIAFAAAAWAAADHRWRNRAGGPAARSVEVVDVDAAGGAVRGRAWLALWRGGNAAVDVAVAAEPGAEAAVSWCADAGGGFGAIDAQVAHPTLAAADYAYGDTLAVLRNVPVAAVSTRLFEAGWSRAAADVVASDLVRDGQGTLRGSFAHHLPFPLTDCRVAHGGWIYDVGDLAPGERHDLAGGRGPRSLSGALARREAVKERQAAARWDRSGTDLARILEIAGFHAAAGGAGYTGLESGRLGRLDLSPLLPLDRAVLVGTAADPPPGWSTAWRVTDDAPGAVPQAPAPATRLYRIVIPLGAPSPPQSRAAERPVE